MFRWKPIAECVSIQSIDCGFNDSGFTGDADHDSDKPEQEPDSQTAYSLARQSVKSGKSASKAEKSSPSPAPHASYLTRFKLLRPDVLTNLGLDLASIGVTKEKVSLRQVCGG